MRLAVDDELHMTSGTHRGVTVLDRAGIVARHVTVAAAYAKALALS